MAHFTWLNDMKKKALEEKMADGKRMVGFAVIPVKARFMGYGEDNQFQKNMPVKMVRTMNGPRMIHEGEAQIENPNGQVTVIPQKDLQRMEHKYRIPGYAEGGEYNTEPVQVNPIQYEQPKFETPVLPKNLQTIQPINAPPPIETPRLPTNLQLNQPINTPTFEPPKLPTIENVQTVPKYEVPTSAFEPPKLPSAPVTTTVKPSVDTNATKIQNAEDYYRKIAMGRINDISRGDFSAVNPMMQRNLDALRKTINTQNLVQGQQSAQQNISPEVAAARMAMAKASGEQSMAGATADIVNARLQEQERATENLAAQSLAGKQFELSKEGQEWQKDIGEKYYNLAREKQTTEKEEFEKTHALSEETLDWNKLIGTKYFDLAYNKQGYDQKVDAINSLLATKDPTNIAQASNLFRDLYPGTTLNVDQMIKDIGTERFAQATKDMATVANTFKTWDEAKNTAEGLKLIETLGGEGNARQLFESSQINAIDEDWRAITDSGFFQGLEEPDQLLLKNFFTASLTGSSNWDIVPQFSVRDTNGNLIQNFNTQEDADKFIATNQEKGYTVIPGSRIAPKNTYGGVGGEEGIGTTSITDPFSPEANTVLKNPDDPNYQTVLNARIAKIKETGDYSSLSGVPSTDPVYKALLGQSTNFDESFTVGDSHQRTFNYAPKEGEVFTYNGQLYKSQGSESVEVDNRMRDRLTAINLRDNTPMTWTAGMGPSGPIMTDVKEIVGKPTDPKYQELLADSPVFDAKNGSTMSVKRIAGAFPLATISFKDAPDINSYFTYNNKLYYVTSQPRTQSIDDRTNVQYFDAIDVASNKTITIDSTGNWTKGA